MATITELVPGGNVEKFFRDVRPIIIIDLMKRYGLIREDAEECFSEGCYALMKNVKDGKLTPENLTVRLSTYLETCCRHHATHILMKKGKQAPMPEGDSMEKMFGTTDDSDMTIAQKRLVEMVGEIIKDLPEPCNTILWSIYYEHYKAGTVAKMLNTKDTVFKVQKNRCMNKLRKRCNSLIEEAI